MCHQQCQAPDGGIDDASRAALGCGRRDLSPVQWSVDPGLVAVHMGRRHYHGYRPPKGLVLADPEKPLEDPEDGCPGADQVCRMITSLTRYMRRVDMQRNRVANPSLDRCDDWLLLDAVQYHELEQDRCHAERERVWDQLAKAKARTR